MGHENGLKERLGAGLAALTAAALCAGPVSAARRASDHEKRILELSEWTEDKDVRDFMTDNYGYDLAFVASIRPDNSSYSGPTVAARMKAFQAGVTAVGSVIDGVQAELVPGDEQNEWVVDQANKTLRTLGEGYDKHIAPANEQANVMIDSIKKLAGILTLVAADNSQCGTADPVLSAAQDAADQTNAIRQTRNGALNSVRAYNPQHASIGQLIVQSADAELRLLSGPAKAYLAKAQNAARMMKQHLKGVEGVLDKAEGYRSELTNYDGQYRQGMDGQASAAESSGSALDKGAMTTFAELAAVSKELSEEGDTLLQGSLGQAFEAIINCSERNKEKGQTMMSSASDQQKIAAIRTALASNLAAVDLLMAATPRIKRVIAMWGNPDSGEGAVAQRKVENRAVAATGSSAEIDGSGARRLAVDDGSKLVSDERSPG